MSKVQVLYEGNQNVELVSNSFNSDSEAIRFKNWMQFIFKKLQKLDVASAEKFQVSVISETLKNPSKKVSKNSKKCCKKSKQSETSELIETGFFSNMYIEVYGKGWLLRPPKNHSDWGKKYYYDGWWHVTQEAWFFKKEKLGDLLFQGAELKENVSSSIPRRKSSRLQKKKVSWEPSVEQGLDLKTYGKGYLLKPEKNHPDWGEKYYHNGWWNQKQQGWFFKKNQLPNFCQEML